MTSLVPREPLSIPDGPEVDVELGCADARFLVELAVKEPDRLFYGLDIREAFLAEGHEAVAAHDLGNLELEVCNLLVDLDHLFAPQRISRFFINFPDPWFKRRQHNRRWLTAEALGHLLDALRPSGEVFFQSDVWELVLEAMALLEAEPRLANVRGEWSFLRDGNPYGVRSTREVICEEGPRPIWRLLYRPVGD